MKKEHTDDIEKEWADWLDALENGNREEAASRPDDAGLSELSGLVRDCNAVFARGKYPQPDAGRAWDQFKDKHIAPRHRHRRMFLWGGSAGAAACILLALLFNWWGGGHGREAFRSTMVFTAAHNVQEVTLSAPDGTMWELGTPQAEASLDKQGIRTTGRTVDYQQAAQAGMQTLTVPRGKDFHLVLADGTEVWLNAESRLVYPSRFGGNERTVQLEGEAYFKVAKDESRPFLVQTNSFNTQVLGTEFNVKSYKGDVPYVTLVSGAVAVKVFQQDKEVQLRPGQELSVQADGRVALRTVDPYYCTQWKEGYFYFDRAPLEEILYELGRWYNVDIELDCHRSILDSHWHFVADKHGTLSDALDKLNALKKVEITHEGNKIILK